MRSFGIEVPAPFRPDLTVWALRHRPHNRLDRFDGVCYRRTLLAGDRPVEVAVRPGAGRGDAAAGLLDGEFRRGVGL